MKRTRIFKGRLLNIYTSRRRLPDNSTGYFEEVAHPGASLVVPYVKDKIVLIRQYRAVIARYIWELPAGTLNKGENPETCAKREITEETGYKARNLKHIGMIYTSPGFCDERIHVFTAICTEKIRHSRDKDEFISVRLFSKRDIRGLVRNGKIHDSKTLSALALSGIL